MDILLYICKSKENIWQIAMESSDMQHTVSFLVVDMSLEFKQEFLSMRYYQVKNVDSCGTFNQSEALKHMYF